MFKPSILFILSVISLLSACGTHQKLPNTLEKYHERVYGVMDIEYKPVNHSSALDAPSKNTLKLEIPDLNIKIREFYAIEGCNLKPLIAQRNTGLGKLQLPSKRLGYEWQLIQALSECEVLTGDEINPRLLVKIREWKALKQGVYHENWANMLTQSDESYLAMTQSSGFIDGDEQDNFTQAKIDLQTLIGVKNNPSKHLSMLEDSLRSAEQHRLYARLWRSQRLITHYLNHMSDDIGTWSDSFTCSTRKDKEKLKIIRNVFTLFFVQEFQGIASQLNNYHYQLQEDFALLSKDESLPDEFTAWFALQTGESFEKYQRAIREHVTLWQELFKKCT